LQYSQCEMCDFERRYNKKKEKKSSSNSERPQGPDARVERSAETERPLA